MTLFKIQKKETFLTDQDMQMIMGYRGLEVLRYKVKRRISKEKTLKKKFLKINL